MRMLMSQAHYIEDGYTRMIIVEEEFQENKPYKAIITSEFIDGEKISENLEYEYIDQFEPVFRVIGSERWHSVNSTLKVPKNLNPCSEILPPPVAKEFIKKHEMEI